MPVPVEENSLEELESEITCPICQEHYTEPKVLPCLHYYCKKCILKLAHMTQSGKSFHCPECRCEATLPEGGVDNLKTAFFVNRLKSKVTTLKRAHEFTNIAVTGVKRKLLKDIQSIKKQQKELSHAIEKIRATALEVETQKESAINNLHTSFKELHNILKQCKQELVEEATTIAQQKLQKLSQQEKTLSLASAELQSVVDYTERCVCLSTDNELVSMDTEIRKTIQQKIQEHSKSGRSLEPVEEADMVVEVTCAEALQQLCLAQANITTAVDPPKCTVDLTAPAEVGKSFVGTLTTRLSNGTPNNRKCKVTCHIKSLYNKVTTDCAIDKDGPGRYSIQYTPTIRGCHELTVLINGHHVAGSPFPVYVSIHPTQLGKPVKIWTGIRTPLGVTANSKGEILVTLSYGTTNIVKYDTKGKRVDLVKKSGLVTPICIACDDEDNIYCVDEHSNKILTCDINGDKLNIHEVKQENNSIGRYALAITDQKLFMTEFGLFGIIMVYNKQLQHLSTIEHKNMSVTDISVDIDHNLYVSDRNNSCIYIFTKDGVHLRSIGHDRDDLNVFWGLCVHGQYVYVIDRISHCVFVFTTDGEHVTSFGQKGQKEGDFDYPGYIHVDNNGFVYVSDFENSRIQCF